MDSLRLYVRERKLVNQFWCGAVEFAKQCRAHGTRFVCFKMNSTIGVESSNPCG